VTRNQRLVSVVLETWSTRHHMNSLLVSKMTKIGISCPLLSIVEYSSLSSESSRPSLMMIKIDTAVSSPLIRQATHQDGVVVVS
jgi:hypothetical protein